MNEQAIQEQYQHRYSTQAATAEGSTIPTGSLSLEQR